MLSTGSNTNTVISLSHHFNQFLETIWLKKAEQELDENDSSRSVKLRQLEERMVQNKDIPNSRRDDAFLLRFLRAKKFVVDKSFRMVPEFNDVSVKTLL